MEQKENSNLQLNELSKVADSPEEKTHSIDNGHDHSHAAGNTLRKGYCLLPTPISERRGLSMRNLRRLSKIPRLHPDFLDMRV